MDSANAENTVQFHLILSEITDFESFKIKKSSLLFK
jgi:hypothetical protein